MKDPLPWNAFAKADEPTVYVASAFETRCCQTKTCQTEREAQGTII